MSQNIVETEYQSSLIIRGTCHQDFQNVAETFVIYEKGSSDRELPLSKSNITRCKCNIRFTYLTVVNK